MTSSSRSEIDLSSLGWPIHEQKPPSSQISAALHTAELPSLGMRICKETSHSTNPFCLWLAYEDLWHEYAQDGWGPPPESPTPPPFSIQHVSGYGNGMVANRAIKTGETILFERPIVIYPSVFICHEDHPRGQWGELEDLYEAGFPALGETERSLYLELWNYKPLTGTLGNKIMGLARTNGLNTTFTRSKHLPVYAGVFPTISRGNHSCGPNASAKFNEETMAMRLFSRRPIAPGEQIMISYVAPLMYAPRQEELKRKYLFTCECNYCKPSKPSRPSRPLKHPFWNTANQTTNKHVDLPMERYASDIRRSQISSRLDYAEKSWVEWLSPSSKQSDRDLLQFHEDALVILAQEGLELMRISHIAYLAHASAALEDEGGFRRWGNILSSLSEWTEGPEGIEQKQPWQNWVSEPTTSPA